MIRDLNTGQFYMISDDDGGGSAKTSGKITDIVGGRELSMDEFQRNLGLEALGLVSSWPCCSPITLLSARLKSSTKKFDKLVYNLDM